MAAGELEEADIHRFHPQLAVAHGENGGCDRKRMEQSCAIRGL
jgi:hypothetical protein